MAGAALEAIMQQKRFLRTQVRQELRNMIPARRSEEDAAIQNHVIASNWFKKSNQICAYVSCANLREVDTTKILAECLKKSEVPKKLFVPRIEDKESHMRMLHIDSIKDLLANSMNILEPTSSNSCGQPRSDVLESTEPVDIILLPGLAFDQAGNRLGRGGGYYDLFLNNYLLHAKEKGWERPLLGMDGACIFDSDTE
ncbi:hypothetical protein O6H91_15G026100 [Diphasiastrum complanatum]|uniref:Uncharacterized protein n=1 Tax=Diphasiastrum complanatum TaxID=34168 RepID=A0ACC2BGK6_DIPCM|nr:hypothetical protein O6H91_15G026100 [Diphasiastrum complanatum]